MRSVSFKDYLKRFLYLKSNMKDVLNKEFDEVTDHEYQNVITSSFKYHRAPYSMTPSSIRLSSAAQRWLKQECVKHFSIFTLGYSPGMNDEEVSEFLTKVIHEEDFNFEDPEELVYWYCYHFNLPYMKAKYILNEYDLIKNEGNSALLMPAKD